VLQENGDFFSDIASAPKRQGSHIARFIRTRLSGRATTEPFRYRHQRDLANIGKRAAVVKFGKLRRQGARAW